jgi:hypothetical protein
MKTRLATFAVALLAVAACADNNASVRLSAICAPTEACSFTGTCEAQTLQPVAIDVTDVPRLLLFVQVDNQLPNNANADARRTNTNDAFVQEYEVEYPGTGLPTARGPIVGSAHVPAAGSAVIALPVVDDATRNILNGPSGLGSNATVDGVAEVKLHGVYADTTRFTTGVFTVNVRACKGPACLIDLCVAGETFVATCPPDAAGQRPASGTCAAP